MVSRLQVLAPVWDLDRAPPPLSLSLSLSLVRDDRLVEALTLTRLKLKATSRGAVLLIICCEIYQADGGKSISACRGFKAAGSAFHLARIKISRAFP